jgi:hypothetical protein
VTGKREEYDIEGIIDPEDIWGEDADQEFIEVRLLLVIVLISLKLWRAVVGLLDSL